MNDMFLSKYLKPLLLNISIPLDICWAHTYIFTKVNDLKHEQNDCIVSREGVRFQRVCNGM